MEKLEITPLGLDNQPITAQSFKVQFNPNSHSVSKTVAWSPQYATPKRNAPRLRFNSAQGRSLTMELFFDVTEPLDRNGFKEPVDDVRELTSRVVALTRMVDKGHGVFEPPIVKLHLGGAPPELSDFPFIGVVHSLTQNFTLFSEIGRPLRATLGVGLTESSDPAQDNLLQVQSTKIQKLMRGVSLARLAAAQYGDPKQWRKIASSDKIDNPLKLDIGGYVKLPAK